MSGGYRNGSGRSKSGYYRGIYCGSTYELCWVIYSLDHNIGFSRFSKRLEKDGVVYYPDFLLSDGKTIIETKGYENPLSVDRKTKVGESFGYTVKVLRKDDLKYTFDYVEKTYHTKKFYELYDGYKPKYSHTCDNCGKQFETDRKVKTEVKFCSRVCSGSFRKKSNSNSETYRKVSLTLKSKTTHNSGYKRKNKQIWITDGKTSTRINLGSTIPDGFRKGR